LLKTLGAASGSLLLTGFPENLDSRTPRPFLEENPNFVKPDKPLTAITLGAGNRGNVYGNYALDFPDELDIVGVAEPIPLRNDRYTQKHQITAANRFNTWEDVFKRPKFADAVLITTPDNLHYGPCMAALQAGYDVLLEKPIAPTEQECRDILALARKTGRIVAVCHVLRYAPYFVKLREIMHSGLIGNVVSLQHLEPIGFTHMSHSYVRGNWHNRQASTPIILAKSCHDLDILRWLIGKPAKKIIAMGSRSWFRREHAPAGSTARCTDGCAVEGNCPYSALKIYYRERGWLSVLDLPEDPSSHGPLILEKLKTTNYGRCVYQMDNDQEDHYISNIEFEEGITASFSMEAFTSYEGRRTRVMGTLGDIVGDMNTFTVTDFLTRQSTVYDSSSMAAAETSKLSGGHGGGDHRLVRDWIQAVTQKNPALLTSTIDASIESHVMGFMAEKSRVTGCLETISV
jgi:predicted dehydrogenase